MFTDQCYLDWSVIYAERIGLNYDAGLDMIARWREELRENRVGLDDLNAAANRVAAGLIDRPLKSLSDHRGAFFGALKAIALERRTRSDMERRRTESESPSLTPAQLRAKLREASWYTPKAERTGEQRTPKAVGR